MRAVPLSLGPVTDAVYAVTVKNGAGDTVWTREIASSQFGDGAGAMSYVGTCDPAANPNKVELVVVSLSDPDGPLSFANPAPPEDPLVELVDCLPNEDASVTFEFTAAVAAEQGFFDVAVTFDDIFCSAKFDCLTDDDGPLHLLFNPLTGERDTTAVLGFACTAGPDQDTYLWMDPVEILCTGGGPFDVNTAGGPGNLDPYFPGPLPDAERLLFQAATYRGVEQLDDTTSWNKAYWNVAVGLNEDAFPLLDTCVLHGFASASDGDFQIGQTPPNVRWPAVQWDVPLIEGGAMTCGRYELDNSDEVKTVYTPSDGHRFYASYRAATEELKIQVGTPDASTVVVCADETLNPGEQTLCSITPRQDGLLVPVEYQDFDGLTSSAGSVSGVSPQELTTSFTFTFTAPPTSQVVTIDTGVGATTTVTVLGTPDVSTTLSCADTLLVSGASTICTITPMAENAPVAASASLFSPSASPDGTVSAIAEPYGTTLHFTYTAGTATGTMTITDGAAASTTLTVYAIPDGTSTVSCQDDRLLPGTQTYCTIVPRVNGQVVLAASSGFSVTASPDGEIGALSPAIGTSFGFLFTAPADLGVKTIDIGFSSPGSRTTVEVYSNVNPDDVVPPGPPSIIEAAGQDGQIYVSYLPPEDDGGSPNLVFTTVCTNQTDGATTATITANHFAIVPNLQNGEPYICVVFASNEAGDGPPSDPTQVIIPNPVPVLPGAVVARSWNAMGADHYQPATQLPADPVGSLVSAAPAFLAANYDVAETPAVTSVLVAAPLGVFGEPARTPDTPPTLAEDVGAIVSGAHAFLGDGYDSGLGQTPTTVVAAPLGVYNADLYVYPPSPLAFAGTLVTAPVQFRAALYQDPFSILVSGAIVAAPLSTYRDPTYSDPAGADERVSQLVASPSVFTGSGYVDAFGDLVSGAVVAGPLATWNAPRYTNPELLPLLATGTLLSAPAVATGSRFQDQFSLVIDGAIVAAPLTTYLATRFTNPSGSDAAATGVLLGAPGVFADDPSLLMHPADPPGPPTITDAFGLDGSISVSWVPPEDDGGAPVTSYTVTCTQTPAPAPPAVASEGTLTTVQQDGTVTALNNGTPYTCVVFATNANGDGPPSDPTTIIIPTAAEEREGPIVAAPLSLFGANYGDRLLAATGVALAAPSEFAAWKNVDPYVLDTVGAVVATPLTAQRSPHVDIPGLASRAEVGVALSAPAALFIDYADEFGAGQLALVVASPWTTYGAHRIFDPAITGVPPVGVVTSAAGAFVENDDFGLSPDQIRLGPVVAAPLSTFAFPRYTTPSLVGAHVGVATSAPGSFAVASYGAADSGDYTGALVATPLTTLGAPYIDHDLVAERTSVVTSTDGVFAGAGYVSPFSDVALGAVTATPLTAYRDDRYTADPVTSVGVLTDGPASFERDPGEPTPTAPPGPPIITDGAAGDATITLFWDPPADDGGSPALLYTVTCTSLDGLNTETTSTSDVTVTVEDLHNGTSYTCVVFATNGFGQGPDSDPSAVLTPNGVHEALSALVAAPLSIFRADRYDDTAVVDVGAIDGAPAAFYGFGGFDTPPASVLVAAPLGVQGAGRYALGGSKLVTASSAPAAFFGAGYEPNFTASSSGPLVVVPLTTYQIQRYGDGALRTATVGQLVTDPATFTEAGQGFTPTSPAGALVAAPWTTYSADRFAPTPDLATLGALTSSPGAFIGAGYTSPRDVTHLTGLVAVSLSTYRAAYYVDPALLPTLDTGVAFGAPRSFAITLNQDTPRLGAVVARPLTAYSAHRQDIVGVTMTPFVSPLVADDAVFANDPDLLTPPPTGLGAPTITDAFATSGQITLSWVPPTEDGGLTITGYEVTCTKTDTGDVLTATTTNLEATLASLVDESPYVCVVHANAGSQHGPDSDPTAILVPHAAPHNSGVLVAGPLSTYRFGAYSDAPFGVVGTLVSGSGAFLGANHQTPFEPVVTTVLTAYPLGVAGADRYAPAAVPTLARTGIVAAPAAFRDGTPPHQSPDVTDGVVAAALSTYRADQYMASPAFLGTTTSPGVDAPHVFARGGQQVDVVSALVATPWNALSASRYDLGASGLTGVAASDPTIFTNQHVSEVALLDGVVAVPLTTYAVGGFDTAGARVSALFSGPGTFAAARYVPAPAAAELGAPVAVPLTAYQSGRYDDVARAVSLHASDPAAWERDSNVPSADHAPSAPTIVTGEASDAAISLTWTVPSDDGGDAALLYTATCTSADGLHEASAVTPFLTIVVTGLHNGTAYTCVVHAANSFGAGPDSAPYGPLTPAATAAGLGALVAQPLTVLNADRNDTAVAAGTTSPVCAAPGAFVGAGYASPQADTLAGLVAQPLTVNSSGGTNATPSVGVVDATPAAFAVDDGVFEIAPMSPLVAAPWSVGSTARFAAADVIDVFPTGAVVGSPGAFEDLIDGTGTLVTLVVATPWGVTGADRYGDPSAESASDLRSAPRAFLADGYQPGQSPVLTGLVAQPLTAFRNTHYSAPLAGTPLVLGPTVAAAGVFANDPELFAAPVAAPPGAPTFTDAVAGDAQATLSWVPPADDGGSSVTSYDVLCDRTDGSDPVHGSTSDLTIAFTGLVNSAFTQTGANVGYVCVVRANNANGAGPDSAPTAIFFPSAAATLNDGLVAAPLAMQGTTGPETPMDTVGALASSAATFFAAGFSDRYQAPTLQALTARPLTLYAASRYATPSIQPSPTVGAIGGAPVALLASGYNAAATYQISSPVVAPPWTVQSAARYAGETTPPARSTIVSDPAVFAAARFVDGFAEGAIGAVVSASWSVVGRPYVYDVQPTPWVAGTAMTVTVSGIGLAQVDHVLFYPPASTTPSDLIITDALTLVDDAFLTLNISLDPSTPPGTWTLGVVTASGTSSPVQEPGTQQGFDNTFTVQIP